MKPTKLKKWYYGRLALKTNYNVLRQKIFT